jgi:hypothetical protein
LEYENEQQFIARRCETIEKWFNVILILNLKIININRKIEFLLFFIKDLFHTPAFINKTLLEFLGVEEAS